MPEVATIISVSRSATILPDILFFIAFFPFINKYLAFFFNHTTTPYYGRYFFTLPSKYFKLCFIALIPYLFFTVVVLIPPPSHLNIPFLHRSMHPKIQGLNNKKHNHFGWAVYPSSQVLLMKCVGNHFRPQNNHAQYYYILLY